MVIKVTFYLPGGILAVQRSHSSSLADVHCLPEEEKLVPLPLKVRRRGASSPSKVAGRSPWPLADHAQFSRLARDR